MFVFIKRKIKQMRRVYYLFIDGTFLFGMASCNENKKNESEPTTEDVTTSDDAESATTSNTDAEVALNPPHVEPGHRCDIQVVQPLPTNTNATNTNTNNSGQRLNPPHGQPGHVCEIPVGQPLPNGSANGSAPSNVQLKTPLMKENQKLNPPHGQPGHVCEIPVGQP